jgi:cytochrome P450
MHMAAVDWRVEDFDSAHPGFQVNPYPTYARMREQAPVHHRKNESGYEMSYCFRYDDVLELLRSADNHTVSIADEVIAGILDQPGSPLYSLARIISSVLLTQDGEDHRRLRGLVGQAFTPRRVEALRPRIGSIIDDLLAKITPRGEMDLLTDFAAPLPIIVIAELLGLPPEDRVQLREWSDRMATFIDGTIREAGIPAAAVAADQMCAYMEEIIEQRRREPRDDLISALALAHEEADQLSDDELLGAIGLILAAGHETTTNLIGNGMLALLRHPDQLAALRREPELIETAVEELLRFDSPVQTTSRVPTHEIAVRGVRIPAGREVGLYLGSANHDPEVFSDPAVLDITRDEGRHLSFGYGAHFCLGASLARLEGQLAILALVERLPGLRLAEQDLAWRSGIVLRGLTRLPLLF